MQTSCLLYDLYDLVLMTLSVFIIVSYDMQTSLVSFVYI